MLENLYETKTLNLVFLGRETGRGQRITALRNQIHFDADAEIICFNALGRRSVLKSSFDCTPCFISNSVA